MNGRRGIYIYIYIYILKVWQKMSVFPQFTPVQCKQCH